MPARLRLPVHYLTYKEFGTNILTMKGTENIGARLASLCSYESDYFLPDVGLTMSERVDLAHDLFDYLTRGGKDSFVQTCGEKKTLWKAGFWNVGTEAQPILWGLEGPGDESGVNIEVFIPVPLQHKLDLMYHGEIAEEIKPWHRNLIETVGYGGTGMGMTVALGDEGPRIRFWGTRLSEQEFVQFINFGSGARLISMARQIKASLALSGALSSIDRAQALLE